MAYAKTIHPEDWANQKAQMAWLGFATGALAGGKTPGDAAKAADALCSQFVQRFVGVDDPTPEA